jgi:hypothetical protein
MNLTPVLKPWAVRSRGDFKVAGTTGLVTVVTGGAGHDIAAFRWANLTYDCIVWYVKWYFNVQTGFTAGQYVQHSLYRAKAFSVSPSAATSLIPAVGQGMKKMSHADSVVTAFQIATTGEITGGTRTLDGIPVQTRGLWCPTTTVVQQAEPVLPPDGYLFYFHAGTAALAEGFVLQNDITMGAAGVITLSMEVAWSEITPDALYMDDKNTSGSVYGGQ